MGICTLPAVQSSGAIVNLPIENLSESLTGIYSTFYILNGHIEKGWLLYI